jgi:hypothetical protein
MCAGFKRILPLPSHSASSLIDPKDAAPVQNRFTISTAGSTCKQTRESLEKIIQPSSLEVLGVPTYNTSNTSNTSTGLSPSAPSEPSGPKGYALVTQNGRDRFGTNWCSIRMYQAISGLIERHGNALFLTKVQLATDLCLLSDPGTGVTTGRKDEWMQWMYSKISKVGNIPATGLW